MHDKAVAVVREWREYVRANGVDRQGLTGLNGRLFGGKRLTGHSCCLSYGSLRVDGYGDWKYMLVNQPVPFLWYTEYFYVLGFTLDGRIVIDTKEMYGGADGQTEYRRAVGDREFCCRLLGTVKKNYAGALLPEVPKGILKLPDRI